MSNRVAGNGSASETLAVTNGIEQGCVLAPIFSNLVFSGLMMGVYRDEVPEIIIDYRTTAQRPPHADTRVFGCALDTTTKSDMQVCMDLFAADRTNFRPTTNTKRTVVMHQPASDADLGEPIIKADVTQLSTMDRFMYLGSTMPRNVKIDDEIVHQISKARRPFGWLLG
nr:unnamed protein product [Spirometra erinaceieuropaei]